MESIDTFREVIWRTLSNGVRVAAGLLAIVGLSSCGMSTGESGVAATHSTAPVADLSDAGGPHLVIAEERDYGLEQGGVEGTIVEVEGCLGLESPTSGELWVLSLPPGTVPIDGGALLPDGTEFIVGAEGVFVWAHSSRPSDESDGQCLGAEFRDVYVPEPG